MKTPCIHVCRAERGRCIGCGRTIMEIAAWSRFTDREREEIMARLRAEGYDTAAAPAPADPPREDRPREGSVAAPVPGPPQAPEAVVLCPATRHLPRSVRIDGIPYGERVVRLVEALQAIADGDGDGETCRAIARRALGKQG
ncbi:MAG: DUF1289 domain-containing protein [Ectothiorhodospira sp.]